MKSVAINSDFGAFLREVERHTVLSREQEFALAVKHRETGDIEAAHALVTSNLRFVVRIARQYASYGATFSDLVQEGSIGLMKAVKKFNPHRGYRLLSYAVWWIRAHMHEHIMRFWSTVRIGGNRTERKLFQKIARAKRAFASGGDDTEKLSDMLGVSPEDISEMEMRMSGRDFSLDSGASEDSAPIDSLADTTPSQETVLERTQSGEMKKKTLKQALATLTERERHIVETRFLSESPATLEDLGSRFGVSAERIRQIERAAISKLRKAPQVALAREIT